MDELRNHPHSVEAEQGVIGSVLLDYRCFEDVIELLTSEDFYIQLHRDIFDTVYAMFAAGGVIDPVTILDGMKSRGVYKEPDSRNYFHRLMTETPSAAHIRQYAAIVREQSLKRKVLDTAGEISAMASEPESEAEKVIEAAEAKFFSIRGDRLSKALQPIPEVLTRVLSHVRALAESGGRLPGLPSGIADLDDMIGGLIDSNFILIASRPGVGKTSLALNIAAHAARFTGKTVVFFSLEMSREQLASRMLSSEAGVSSNSLLKGSLTDKEWERLGSAASTLARLPIQFNDNAGISVPDMKATCRRVKNLGMIVIDYLQLMHGTPGKRYDNRTAEVGDISRSVKVMAKELNVPVLCCAQLSRESEKQGRSARMSDLRESGSIEQDADVILFLQRGSKETADTLDENEVELAVAKNRHGSTGSIRLEWQGQYTRFSEKEWRHEA
ncbi:MAG: replicative DNA helicase [Oscillospiraceae bacterium]|jgi:replicative DNA helicase|nr:replicative DNA helicase [Oscillospiraceae bacterium]